MMASGEYEVECPFCGYVIGMGSTEYPYTKSRCAGCGAKLNMDNYEEAVHSIVELPRLEFEWNSYAKRDTFPRDSFASREEALDRLVEMVSDSPESFSRVKEPTVSDERIAEVLEAGVNGEADYSVSSKKLTERDLSEFGVEVGR